MIEFRKKVQERFNELCSTGKLFRVDLTGDQVWERYITAFDHDPVFRDPSSSEHNCNNCKNFIRRYGNVVAVVDNKVKSMFGVDIEGEFAPVVDLLTKYVESAPIKNVFFETFDELNSLPYEKTNKVQEVFQLGMLKNTKMYTKEEAEKYGVVKEGEIRTFQHLSLSIQKQFVDMTGQSVEAIIGSYRDAKEVFKRAMDTISLDTLMLVKDLIHQGSLLDGTTHVHKIERIIPLKAGYDKLPEDQRDAWCWITSYKLPYAKFRNELIGVLCSELSEGKELNEAVKAWNKRVDPVNYMKTTAPITKTQIAAAEAFVNENGYAESFDRRYATITDIKVSEIKHINAGEGKVKSVSVFDKVKPSASTRHKRSEFEGIEEVPIEKFMKDILPSCSSVEVFLRNSHEGNMVTLTTASNPDSNRIFKWDNNYSWTYNGNLAGKSQIKQAVKDAGGNVEGVLNFRLAWNDGERGDDNSDLDAWAKEPDNNLIGYNTRYRRDRYGNARTRMSGQLDVDNTQPSGKMAVENITWIDKNKMREGTYELFVHQFAARNSQGFKAEIEFGGETYSYEYNRPLIQGYRILVAKVHINNGQFSIDHVLPETGVSSKEIYGLNTNEFHRVNLVCLSPNHWGQNNVGNKHYFFMLEGCKCPTAIRSFHNENLIPELLQHRKVMEVLGTTHMIEPKKGDQLSGLGFNATIRDELIVRLSGNFKRTLKLKF